LEPNTFINSKKTFVGICLPESTARIIFPVETDLIYKVDNMT
jgi:hypothetical protein